MPGRDVCYWHGGKTPRGIALPQTKTGRYSKDLPTRLLADFELARKDPELLGLEQEIALLDTRTAELLKRIGTGESGTTWRDVKTSFASLKLAITEGDAITMRFALGELEHLILTGASEERVWIDVRATLEHRRRLVESERKRRVEMQQMLSSSQAALLVRTLVESVRAHVTDIDVLGAITADLSRFSLG